MGWVWVQSLGAQTCRMMGPHPVLVPTPPAQGEDVDVGRAARMPTVSCHITKGMSWREREGMGQLANTQGRGRTAALLVGLQSATELSLSLHLPISLGGQACHPHFTGGETGCPGDSQTLAPSPQFLPHTQLGHHRPWPREELRWGCVDWTGSSLSLSGTL